MLRLLIATVGLIDVLNGFPMMKPRKEFWPDSVAPLPAIVTFFVTAGRFEPNVMSDVKVIVSPFAALLMALARLLGVLTSKSLANAGRASDEAPAKQGN